MKQVDTIIHARWIVPVEPDDRVLQTHALVIDDGRILDIIHQSEVDTHYTATHTHQLGEHVLIPGLVNAHTHLAMSLMRGLADDLPLMQWLGEHIWPAEGKFVSQEFIRDGSLLGMAEMLRSGTTCFNDMYFFPDEVARQAEHVGIRAVVGLIVIEFPTVWAQDAAEYLHKGLEVHDQIRSNPLVTAAFAPHAPYTVSDETLSKVCMYAEELDIPIHMHVHETADEVHQGIEQTGERPFKRLAAQGLFSPRLLAVHMTQLTDEEITHVAASNAHVVHCPESNLKLASGFCPVQKLIDAGVNVALGTDGTASNNDLDMLGEMRTAALLAKGVAGDASALPAYQALRMATINGARALGLHEHTGSLEIGKAADVVAIRLDDLETQPIYHPLSHLVYAASRDKVSDVWVAGNHLLKGRRLTTIDEQAVLAKARQWQAKIHNQEQQG